jgi:hypothetical protein
MDSSNITFFKFIYQPFTDFGDGIEPISNEQLKQETIEETPDIKFLKLPINWCINPKKLEDLGNNRFRINIKYHSLDNRICYYNELGQWKLE